ncbi:MAG: PD-(D/E)XK nuclease family protein, partial [Bacteroidia bacterium]|nr:PD-(D/E)XK nuclease family protein [Bacteroidia bacterium]
YAYYFYRLIQRTKSLHIYYLTGHRDDVIRSGEKSRYITQLMYEFPEKIGFRLEPPARAGNLSNPIIIRKDGVVKERLDRYLAGSHASKSLSPSAINDYLDCSLRFALKRIFDLKEPDEIAYASEPKGFGILVHQVMNRLYKEFVGNEQGPDVEWLQQSISSHDRMGEIIREEYNVVLQEAGAVKPGGKEVLAMEVVRQFLNKILEFDQLINPLRILDLEQKFRLEYPIEIDGQKVSVNMNGIIDRIDQVAEGIRIIDYKTGNCELNAKSIDEIFNREAVTRPKEVFQVLLYCEFYLNQTSTTLDLIPCLFRLGRFRGGDNDNRVKVAGKDIVFSEIRDEFNAGFKTILEDLFHPDIPFAQSENDQVCRYCPFTGICSRENYS